MHACAWGVERSTATTNGRGKSRGRGAVEAGPKEKCFRSARLVCALGAGKLQGGCLSYPPPPETKRENVVRAGG